MNFCYTMDHYDGHWTTIWPSEHGTMRGWKVH